MRRVPAVAALLMALAGCGERATPDTSRDGPDLNRVDAGASAGAVPVRVGEAGPNFRACQAAGTTRNLDPAAGEMLPVRAAPFESSRPSGRIAAEARFFVCARSIDQRWLGVVYEPGGTLSPECGVTAPAPRRTDYAGPCASGWVASAYVRFVAG